MEDDSTGVPRQLTGLHLPDTAVRYAEERHWEVLPGCWLEVNTGGAPHCSCASPSCPSPGAHPVTPDWAAEATGNAAALRALWRRRPRASVLLPTGRTFDVIDVSEPAGLHALARIERMDLTVGPVIATPSRRLLFFVLPGAAAKVPELLGRLGWTPATLDLTARGDGDWVAAPPTRTIGGVAQWARRPTALNRWLPDVEELLGPLAYACGQETARARGALGPRR